MNSKGVERGSTTDINNHIDMEALLRGLRKEDARNLRLTRNFRRMLLIMVVIYAGLLVVNPDPDVKLHSRLTGLCYCAAFILFAMVFKKLYNEFKAVDYSVSSIEMLSSAAKRYEYNLMKIVYVVPSLLLIDAGFTISVFSTHEELSPVNRILIIQALYFGLMTLSAFTGYLIWRRKKKPLRDNALRMLKELQEF